MAKRFQRYPVGSLQPLEKASRLSPFLAEACMHVQMVVKCMCKYSKSISINFLFDNDIVVQVYVLISRQYIMRKIIVMCLCVCL